jgi:uncharacterized protein (TIGR02453 family)
MTIEQETINFLRNLATNNNREWFQSHKIEYQKARANFGDLISDILVSLQAEEPRLSGLMVGDCVFRIYRDVRFSKNKSPYKTHFSAAINRGGRKAIYPGYYLHIQPADESFIAGGLFKPPNPVLRAVRQEIDYNLSDFKAILGESDFRNTFGRLWPDMLKTVPRGYDKGNPALEFLRYRSFIATHPISDKLLESEGFLDYVLHVFRQLRKLNSFLELPFNDEQYLPELQNLDE